MLRAIGHGCLWLLLLIIGIPMLPMSIPSSVSSAAPEVSWQVLQEPIVELGVRNKTGSLDRFAAVWIVTAPDGSRYGAKARVERLNIGIVKFPDDFQTNAKPGRYSWKCLVDGRQIAVGSFEFKTVETYSDQLTVRRLGMLHQ